MDSTIELSVIPTTDVVVFPHVPASLGIGNPETLKLLEAVQAKPTPVFVALCKSPPEALPSGDDLYEVGTIAQVHALREPSPGAGVRLIVLHGTQRARLVGISARQPFLTARVQPLEDVEPPADDLEYQALRQNVVHLFVELVSHSPFLSNDLIQIALSLQPTAAIADFAAGVLPGLELSVRQKLLATLDVKVRMRLLHDLLVKLRETQELQEKLRAEVQQKLAGDQHQFMLREELKAIQRELGEPDERQREVLLLQGRLEKLNLPAEMAAEAKRQLARLQDLNEASAEYPVVRTWLDCVLALPWATSTAGPVDIERAARVLDEDHDDLARVKERILEFIAVLQLKRDQKAPLLCFAGPPGVGKTSVGKSIARALGRRFVRLSLGGIQDEAEIRGHRRTYVGALPGQILHGLKRAGSNDPVFMLDEIDKLGRDFRGDPAAALLEVLDPEQNFAFRDNYLDAPFDLSRVLFIATANVMDPVPPALRDRMEVVELPGYTEEEKLGIARRFLVPRQVEQAGLGLGTDIRFSDAALVEVIRAYTREAGVRGLERNIASLCRKQARQVAGGRRGLLDLGPAEVHERLGPVQFFVESALADRVRSPGVAIGLAWTPSGGDIVVVEAARTPRGKGRLTITGQLGSTMEESVRAALTWVKAHAAAQGVAASAFEKCDLHVHVPAGGVPKDGPSAGVAMVAALVSLFSDRPLRPLLAFSGEVTLSGRVLPVGGIKEKVLAAQRAGVRELVLPALNRANVEADVSEAVRAGLRFHYAATLEEALATAFGVPTQ